MISKRDGLGFGSVRRIEGGEPVERQSLCLVLARFVAGDGGEEVVAVERVEPDGRARPYCRGPQRVVQQGDLAESVSRPQRADSAVVADHLGYIGTAAGRDRVAIPRNAMT